VREITTETQRKARGENLQKHRSPDVPGFDCAKNVESLLHQKELGHFCEPHSTESIAHR
jgi:hypothetical protein